ncbi:T9SS type A sorting domain-containing protein [Flavobacterium sp. MMLR14_040]|uniref:T9SS type A sorting domain-containing protein n=1 Tax=Flavobacterium sp. MMLR14_040 TaxID=3093843 RepID=UPI00298F8FB7|nr:T9SS type A sorting domain-containing protein [Flavobacterium sp. MMLR14_040]MDW8850808.1 T9SS type A sorting domain-containing protein [Flavobacterium sp. MMLR14_040]
MKRKLLLFILFLCTFFVQQNLRAQPTVLAPGDIAFIGYQTGTSTDGFSFITLKSINAGTLVYFTENGWGDGAWISPNVETHLLWTVPAFTPAGTIISIVETAADSFTVTGTTGGSITIASGSAFNLLGGDQILAYQGASVKPVSPTFIAGIHGDYNSSIYDPVTTWDTKAGAAIGGGAESSLPPGLTNGTNCISLFPAPGPEIVNSKYIGTLTGTVAELLAKINNPSSTYWSHSTGTTDLGIIPSNYPAPLVSTAVAPTVTTTAATNVKSVSATLAGNVTADGGDASIERGIVWATTANPTTANTKVQIGTGTGAFSNLVTALPAATTIHYRAYATNSGGTGYGSDLTFTTGAALSTSSTPQTNVSCNGGNNGSASVVVTGGTTPYTYSWSPSGGTNAAATGLAAGNYTVTITDGESTQITRIFNITQPSILNGAPAVTNVACNGGSNGVASITASGGTPGYTYLWNTGATTSAITGLTAGTYSVTITDANACTKLVSNIIVAQPSVLTASQGTINNVSCNGGSNGSATVTATGGAGGYTYSWSPSGGTAATASGLSQGNYTVTVTDANSCQATQNFTISQPTPFSVTTSQTDILCNGAATGSAGVNVTGGTGDYTYSWSPSGGTAAIATGLTAGTYTVTIKDANLCQTTRTFTINQPSMLLATASAQTNIGCRGDATGSATVNVTGGTPGYTYSWAPSGGTAATATGLTAGTYTVTVKDANLCQTTQSFTITQPVAILSATTATVGVSCFGGSNGSASVTVSGGTPGYTYSWTPLGGTTGTITGRPAGNYTCTITDANGCTLIKNVTINTPSLFSANAVKTDVSCNGGTNGTATVSASGGTPGYTYSWSPSGGTAATATGLAAGTYTVTVTDANTCQTTATVTVGQPSVLVASTAQTDALCNGSASGTASVIVSGGAGGYTYVWSPSGGTSSTATGLAAGNYSCLITDANGCTLTKNFTITQPLVLNATTTLINATCTTGGQAAVGPVGGTPPYNYLWSPSGATTQTVTGLSNGNVSCLITDANGCTVTKNFTVTTTNTLVATTSQTNILCNGSNTGTATVVPSGAPGPFTYIWSPAGGNSATAVGLSAGNYSVTITSSNGCSIVKNFTITEPTALTVTPSQTNISCSGGSNGSASVSVTGGTGAYTYAWSPSGGTAATATGLAAGTYTVTVTDANLCQTTQSFTITEPAAIATTVSQTNVSCNGGSNGSASVSVTGGTGAYTYVWSPSGGTAATASGLSAGTYTVTVTDANLCQTTAVVTITEPAILAATTSQVNVSCNGQSDGSATVNVTGGTGSYTYSWAPSGGTADTASGLSAGTYTVTVTDANSCTLTQTVTITTIPDVTLPVPDVTNLPDITNYCSVLPAEIAIPTANDNCSGIITATTADPLSYTTVGNYVINWIYTDDSGNTASQQQNINVIASPLDQVTFTDAEFTYSGSVHTIEVANLPAGASVVYTTTPSTGTSNGAVDAGFYTVTATVSPSVSSPNCSPITLTAQLEIKKASQQITFGALAARILGINNDFSLDASANSGLPIRYSFTYTSALPPANVSASGLVNMIRSGQLVITAHQDGDDNYLPAVSVSQILVIKNNDVSITSITINGDVYSNPAKDITYVMECGENNPNIAILNSTNATITPSANFTVQTPKPGIYTQNVTITSEDGSSTANYTIKVEKPFGFYDIVKQKFNNVLLVNNNPQTNGGYEFTAYQWFKNGQLIGTGQYYTAGNESNNVLDPTASYSVKMTTKDGKVLQTCGSTITVQNSLQTKLYPNPIEVGKVLTVEADFPAEDLANMQISLYSVSGKLVKTVQSSSVITEIQLPATTESNMYLVVLESANIKKSFKVIVK